MKDKILLVDDNKAELTLCIQALKLTKIPNDLIIFDKPKEALQYLKKNAEEVLIVVSDIDMPGMTGMQLLEAINEDHELRMQALPFIFLSNGSNPEDVEHAFTLAAQGYFEKPISLIDLSKIFIIIVSYWDTSQLPRFIHGNHLKTDYKNWF